MYRGFYDGTSARWTSIADWRTRLAGRCYGVSGNVRKLARPAARCLAQIDTNASFTVPPVAAEATVKTEIDLRSVLMVNHDQPENLEIGVHLGSDGVTHASTRHRGPAQRPDRQHRSNLSARALASDSSLRAGSRSQQVPAAGAWPLATFGEFGRCGTP